MNTLTDSKQIILSSNGADVKFNDSLNSDLQFNISKLIKKDNSVLYNTIKIIHAEFPYSFYIINEYNNILALSTGIITLPFGNYNANTFMSSVQLLLPTNMLITFNSINGKYTITYNLTFSILAGSTCFSLMGFDKDIIYTSTISTLKTLELPYPANFLGSKNLYIKSPNVILENFNSVTKDFNTLLSIPINVSPFGFIMYENKSNSHNLIKNQYLDLILIQICDDDNNLVDFNNINWSITLEIETVIQVLQNTKTIKEYLAELYSNN